VRVVRPPRQSSLFASGHVIAAEKSGGAVWGMGRTDAEARKDAAKAIKDYGPATAPDLVVMPATPALIEKLEAVGGGPELRWTCWEGVARLTSERVLACETDR
jgi:hypothetical protein